MECPKCGHINPDTAMNCEKCRINLESAREHWEDKRRGMEVQKRRKPPMAAGVYVFSVVVGIASLILFVLGYIRDEEWKGWAGLFSAFGIGLLGSGLVELLSPGSAYNVFRRSSATARAKVLCHRTETRESGDDVYKVIVRFNAVQSGGAFEQVTLEARVSKRLYDRLGTEVTVRYASEDPRIAFLEGEKGRTAHMLKEPFNTVRSLFCLLGQHRGEWKYESPNECAEIRICERCGTKSRRRRHVYPPAWEYCYPNKCIQIGICKRCGAKWQERTRHDWGKWGNRCRRCGETPPAVDHWDGDCWT